MRENHDEYREQDEWVCPKCGCRWGIDEQSPEECRRKRRNETENKKNISRRLYGRCT